MVTPVNWRKAIDKAEEPNAPVGAHVPTWMKAHSLAIPFEELLPPEVPISPENYDSYVVMHNQMVWSIYTALIAEEAEAAAEFLAARSVEVSE